MHLLQVEPNHSQLAPMQDTSSYGSSDSMTKVAALPGTKQLAVIRDVDDEGRAALWYAYSVLAGFIILAGALQML